MSLLTCGNLKLLFMLIYLDLMHTNTILKQWFLIISIRFRIIFEKNAVLLEIILILRVTRRLPNYLSLLILHAKINLLT